MCPPLSWSSTARKSGVSLLALYPYCVSNFSNDFSARRQFSNQIGRLKMLHQTRLSALVGTTLAAVALSAPAHAQATRTWVSGVGNDANPCSLTAPCKTFAGAISKTFINGEIDCLDPGGFGTITITKSITIDCTGTFGSMLASGTNGVNVNIAVHANDPFR